MAENVDIGGGKTAKVRNIWAVAILSVVTLGIYVLFWWYFANREMADYGKAKGTTELGESPGKSVLALTLGALIIVPAILTIINTFRRVQKAQNAAGLDSAINGWIGLVLLLVISPAFYAYMQSGLNAAWKASAQMQAAPVPAA